MWVPGRGEGASAQGGNGLLQELLQLLMGVVRGVPAKAALGFDNPRGSQDRNAGEPPGPSKSHMTAEILLLT